MICSDLVGSGFGPRINKIESDDFNFDQIIILDNKDYVPLACLFVDDMYRNSMINIDANIKAHIMSSAPWLVNKINMPQKYNPRRQYYHTERSNEALENIIRSLKHYVNQPAFFYLGKPERSYSRTSYDNISTSFFKAFEDIYYLQSMKKLKSGKGFIFHTEKQDILMMMVVKKELFKYQKLHLITEGDLDYRGIEFWIKREIDTPRYKYKGFRKMYRNSIKPKLQEYNIPIFEKENINDILVSTLDVSQSSIIELEEWKHNLFNSVVELEQEEMEFHFQ